MSLHYIRSIKGSKNRFAATIHVAQSRAAMSETAQPTDQSDCLTYTVPKLLSLSSEGEKWLIKDVLRPGGQMLLSGPPKSGKSLIAAEIALCLALPFNGEKKRLFGLPIGPSDQVLPFEIAIPTGDAYNVLFFSLEMHPPEVGYRLKLQLDGLGQLEAAKEGKVRIPLTHVFGVAENGLERRNLRVFTSVQGAKSDFKTITDIIRREQPDLVVLDTLVQLHQEDENENVAMNAVMKAIRSACVKEESFPDGTRRTSPIAHIIVHHNRKGSGIGRGPAAGPEEMRGAGAVHGAVDIALILSAGYEPRTIFVEASSRSSSIDRFTLLREATLLHRVVTTQTTKKECRRDFVDRTFRKTVADILDRNGGSIVWAEPFWREVRSVPDLADVKDSSLARRIKGFINNRLLAYGDGNCLKKGACLVRGTVSF